MRSGHEVSTHLLLLAGAALLLGSPAGVRGQVPSARQPQAEKYDSTATAKLFEQRCGACHGKSGRGDGPAAAALQPKPADFSDPKFQAGRTDAQLREMVASGKGLMPGFGKTLKPEEIEDLIKYMRSLARKP